MDDYFSSKSQSMNLIRKKRARAIRARRRCIRENCAGFFAVGIVLIIPVCRSCTNCTQLTGIMKKRWRFTVWEAFVELQAALLWNKIQFVFVLLFVVAVVIDGVFLFSRQGQRNHRWIINTNDSIALYILCCWWVIHWFSFDVCIIVADRQFSS